MDYVNPEIEEQLQTDVDVLLYKAILKYMDVLNDMLMGRPVNSEYLLEIISLIDIYSALDHHKQYYKSFYINV